MSNSTYTFTNKTRNFTFALMAIGLIAIITGFIGNSPDDPDHTRLWANLLLNGYFFMGIGLLATFFMALQYAAEVAWSVAVKRVYEALSCYLPVGASIIFLILLLGQLHVHHLYQWMDPAMYDKTSPKYDDLIAHKHGYFSPAFFWTRTVAYLIIWSMFQRGFRKRSLEEDLVGGTALHYKNMGKGALFLVFFAFTSSTSAWDWLMSLDVHWFSTMYGWYAFSGMWLSAMTTMMLVILFLKRKGYLENVNQSHIHDVGKWMFATSFLWSYLWFMQFMLIWYTNIPEETIYFHDRIHKYGYVGLMWTVFFMNFAFPMVLLMSRDAKRNSFFLIFVGCITIVGHWLDVFMMVMPATVKDKWHLGGLELGIAMGFLGLIIYVINASLAKAPLTVQKHPYLDESLHHSV